MKKNKGFTLIELLVVIAIIGILAAIVLVSLSGARNKAKDARISADLSQIRSTAEMVYTDATPNSYAALCTGTALASNGTYGTALASVATDINDQNGTTYNAPVCYADGSNYCVSAQLTGGGNVCVSSAGQTGNDACTAANSTCNN